MRSLECFTFLILRIPNITELGMDLQNELDFAIDLIKSTSKRVLELHRSEGSSYELKEDKSKVTEADRIINEILVKVIAKEFRNDLVIGEESASSVDSKNKRRTWLIDPIDGTADFIRGNDQWAIQIGLVDRETAVMGLVARPLRDELFFARQGAGSFVTSLSSTTKATQIHCSNCSDIKVARLIESSNRIDPTTAQFRAEGFNNELIRTGSLGIKLGEIAKSKADLYFNSSHHCGLWDVCGPQVILEEAGGLLLDFQGNKITYRLNQGPKLTTKVFACNKSLRDSVLSWLSRENPTSSNSLHT